MRIRSPLLVLVLYIAAALVGACAGTPSPTADDHRPKAEVAALVVIDLEPFAVHLTAPHDRQRSRLAVDRAMQLLENDVAHCVLGSASEPVPDDGATVVISVAARGDVTTWSLAEPPASPVVAGCIDALVPAVRLPVAGEPIEITARLRYRAFATDRGSKTIEFAPFPLEDSVENALRDDALKTFVDAPRLAGCQRPADDRGATNGHYRVELAVDGDGIPVDIAFDRVDGPLDPAVERCVRGGIAALRFAAGPRREIRTDIQLYGNVEWPLALGDVRYPRPGVAVVGLGFSQFEAIGAIAAIAAQIRQCSDDVPSPNPFDVVWAVVPPGVIDRIEVTGELDSEQRRCVEQVAAGAVFPATSIHTEVTAPWVVPATLPASARD